MDSCSKKYNPHAFILPATFRTFLFDNRLENSLFSIDSGNMVSIMKAIATLLVVCLSILAAALPANDYTPTDDSLLSLNDTLSLNESQPANETQPKREDWKSAFVACEWKYKGLWNTYKIQGEGWVQREEEVERKTKTAADRTGLVTKWKVKHFPPEGDQKSTVEITVSPRAPGFVACRWSLYCY